MIRLCGLADVLAMSLWSLPGQLGHIFYFIVLPMLLLAGLGWIMQRKLRLEMQTLTKLNFYMVIPAMVYYALVTSNLTAAEAGQTILVVVGLMASMTVLTLLAAWLRRVPAAQRRSLVMTSIFFNAGNYGLPLQDLAFSGASQTPQAIQGLIMITQNVITFTIGVLLAAGGHKDRHWKQNLLHIVRFPPLYALAAALLTLCIRNALGDQADDVASALSPFWKALLYVKDAFFAVALVTLGAQLAMVQSAQHNYPIKLSVILRLAVAPAVALAVIYAFGVRGLLAQGLLIGTCTPTAVNTLLLCLEFNNHPDFAARSVFYSTLISPVSVTLVVFMAQSGVLPGF